MHTKTFQTRDKAVAAPGRPPLENPCTPPWEPGSARDEHVTVDGEPFLLIRDVDGMAPFLMTVVSDSDVWLFVGSNTGLTAGRKDPDHAVFPYQTADKILQQPKASGVFCLVDVDGEIWEPWNRPVSSADVMRNLYKHATGASLRFEEIHHRLQIRLCWTLASSEEFGLVRTCHLENFGDRDREIRLLDGWRQLLPPGVNQDTYARYSYLASAYMRHECLADCDLGVYTLNSGVSDRAEPSEMLRVGVAWSLGHSDPVLLLSDRQVDAFRSGGEVVSESEVRGEFGAYLTASRFKLAAGGCHDWFVVADGGLDHAGLVGLRERLLDREGMRDVLAGDLEANLNALKARVAGADAMQQTADHAASVHHFANALFNCMRGGTLHDGYRFLRADFEAFLKARNADLWKRHESWAASLPETGLLGELDAGALATGDPQLVRLAREYLPLTFSRRHGDPSRPWNRFEIRTRDDDGNPVLGYSGNWRDIFQNWESLAYSYPECFKSMVTVFLNASTADGYNPYRITREGIDWEVFDPKDPWSHIGYWGDHQIIYLLRLLEGHEHFRPGDLAGHLDERLYAYANVPYEIRDFDALVADPRQSIAFNDGLHEELTARSKALGGDGKLLAGADGEVALVSLGEKLLVPVLVKLGNLIPGGGIWLNTQRPEWNDANNALAGWGLSVVTVCYLRRYLDFLGELLDACELDALELSTPVADLLRELAGVLPDAAAELDDEARRSVMTALGRAGETHRRAVYRREVFESTRVGLAGLRDFVRVAIRAVDRTIDSNLRDDGMYHSYNVLDLGEGRATVKHLDVMLEGQVAALGSRRLGADEALRLLGAMRQSGLYREDQHSYLLYPNREMTPFLERNMLPADWAQRAPLMAELVKAGKSCMGTVDANGDGHFNADFACARDVAGRLDELAGEAGWAERVAADRGAVLELWEEVFNHRAFTGRSGAMFCFEGLGSIYWHMVAKLLLAVQEIYQKEAADDPKDEAALKLADAYYDIRRGLGFTKTAEVYGAFPSDPYSHSPGHRGAQQPGMTGQVKEEILSRRGELGVLVRGGLVHFEPTLLKAGEFFKSPHGFEYLDIGGVANEWRMEAGTLAFTLCQVPVCYELAEQASIRVERTDGGGETHAGNVLPHDESLELFRRSGVIRKLRVGIPASLILP